MIVTPPCSCGTAGAVTGRMAAPPAPLTAMTTSAMTIMKSGEPGIIMSLNQSGLLQSVCAGARVTTAMSTLPRAAAGTLMAGC